MRRALLTLTTLALAAVVALGWSGPASAAAAAANDTTTTLTVAPSSIAVGDDITLTATVHGSTVPSGSVLIKGDGQSLVTLPLEPVPGSSTDAQATITMPSGFAAGTHTLVAYFATDDATKWNYSTSSVSTLTVGGVPIHNVTITLSGTPSAPVAGDPFTLTAHLVRDDGTIPTGTVTFRDNGVTVGDAPIVNGYATLTRSDYGGGSHRFVVDYVGQITDSIQSNALDVTVQPAVVPSPTPTTVSGWATPATIHPEDAVVLHALVADTATGAPVGYGAVAFINVTSGRVSLATVSVDSAGNVTLPTTGWPVGTYRIEADYSGPGRTALPTSFTFKVVDATQPVASDTTLVAAPATGIAGLPTTLKATLAAGSTPVVGEPVTLAAGGQSCTAVTGADGVAQCDVTVAAAGSYALTATYTGSTAYNPSTGSSTLVVTKASTALTVPSITVVSGEPATLSATLTAGAVPVGGKSVTLAAGTQSCTAATTAAGLASCTISFDQVPGSYALNASFAGDETYAAATGAGTLTATGQTTTLFVLPSIGVYHHTAILSARLTDATGASLATQTVTLSVGSRTCSDVTNALGLAICTITVDTAPGTAPIVGTFGGAIGYAGSTDTSTILIAKQPTAITITSSPVQQSGVATVTAKLTDDTGDPIASAPVVLTLGSTSQTVTTNAAGIATATFTGRTAGSYAVSARYAGNAYYAPSATSSADRLTCYDDSRFLIWGGNANDLDAAVRIGDHVTFWGAQWSKQVARGDYSGGSSLKGWTDKVSGSTWSTSTGNSTTAPKSVASYISVLVTTKVTKSGSTLNGNTVRRVVIRVDDPDGYDANPGHAAAGTVVAIL